MTATGSRHIYGPVPSRRLGRSLGIDLVPFKTGTESEVKKIAALVKRIGPARTQINTVPRPPAEEFAYPLAADQLNVLKGFFPGRVEIICESERPDTPA